MRTINVQCGIFNTAYRATYHRDGAITVRAPYVNRRGNSGNLAFELTKVSGTRATAVRWFFDNQASCFFDGENWSASLDDVLAGLIPDASLRHIA
jgi:hypothetical protein